MRYSSPPKYKLLEEQFMKEKEEEEIKREEILKRIREERRSVRIQEIQEHCKIVDMMKHSYQRTKPFKDETNLTRVETFARPNSDFE